MTRILLRVVCYLLVAVSASAQVSSLQPEQGEADLVLLPEAWRTLEPKSLDELLSHFAGIHLTRSGGLGSRTLMQVSGSGAGRVRIVVDGVELNEPQWGWARLQSIPIFRIARIEIFRTSDPARIEIFSKTPPFKAPITDFDLARGDLVTRTRRVSLQTPRRAVRAGVHYEEVLRGTHDFRSLRQGSVPSLLGAYDGRRVTVDLEFETSNKSNLLLRHFNLNENSHGTYLSAFDVYRSENIGSEVHYRRAIRDWKLLLNLSHVAWGRQQQLDGVRTDLSESRVAAAVDLVLPPRGAYQSDLRLRAQDERGESRVRGTLSRGAARRADVDFGVKRSGTWWWLARGSAHSHARWGTTWAGSYRVGTQWKSGWTAQAAMGRGVSFAGIGESLAEAGDGIRPGTFLSTAISHRRARFESRLEGFWKRFERGAPASSFLFIAQGGGAQDRAGLLHSLRWRRPMGEYTGQIIGRWSWSRSWDGQEIGLPDFQGEFIARLDSREWFQGDLLTTFQGVVHLAGARKFLSGDRIEPQARVDALLNVRILKRLVFFWNINNVLDAEETSFPGVEFPGRRSLLGAKLTLVN